MATNPDINPGALAEALTNKADTDVENITTSGVKLLTSYGFPSDKFENLTLGATGSTYTAPADGWYFLGKASTAAGQHMGFSVYDSTGSVLLYQDYKTMAIAPTLETIGVPVSKGMVVAISYNIAGDTSYFRFVYAKGNEPQS